MAMTSDSVCLETRSAVRSRVPVSRLRIVGSGISWTLAAAIFVEFAHLEYVAREPAVIAAPYSGRYPRAWGRGSTPNTLAPWTPGTLRLTPSVPRAGRYDVWLAGSFASDVEIVVDGRRAGQVTGLANQGDYTPAGTVRLEAGSHVVEVRYPRRTLSPGTGVPLAEIGPLALAPVRNRDANVVTLPAERAGDLCGRSLDWVEVVRPAAGAAAAG